MSRLDSFIRRLQAQRDLLNDLARPGALPPGPIMELGLGNGRTYHHLREMFPDRRVVAFDRALAAHEASIPPEDDLVLGEIEETARGFVGCAAALVHADIGTGFEDRDAVGLAWLPALVVGLLAPGGIAMSGVKLPHPELAPLPLPDSVPPGRYHLYRRQAPAG